MHQLPLSPLDHKAIAAGQGVPPRYSCSLLRPDERSGQTTIRSRRGVRLQLVFAVFYTMPIWCMNRRDGGEQWP